MSDTPADVDRQLHGRAARHVVSLTLAVHAVALAVLAAINLATSGTTVSELLLVPGVYAVLWVVLRVRGRTTGTRAGADGVGVVAVAALVLQLVFPLPGMFPGSGTLLGLGLVALAVRLRERLLAVGGVLLVAVHPFVNLFTFENHARFLGPRPGVVVGVLLAVAVAALAVRARGDEREVLREPVPA